MGILEFLQQPWAWYVAGPLIGLTVPALLLLGDKKFGISANFRHACAMTPNNVSFFQYNWRKESWNLLFALGIVLGGLVGSTLLNNGEPLQIATQTATALESLGITVDGELVPQQIFANFSVGNIAILLIGGLLVGFGARYAGGCTSGHAISGLSDLQLPSLVAVIGFFIGGLVMTYLLFPLIF
jgi:uncharacterized membrane protein YedE/YeeE